MGLAGLVLDNTWPPRLNDFDFTVFLQKCIVMVPFYVYTFISSFPTSYSRSHKISHLDPALTPTASAILTSDDDTSGDDACRPRFASGSPASWAVRLVLLGTVSNVRQ